MIIRGYAMYWENPHNEAFGLIKVTPYDFIVIGCFHLHILHNCATMKKGCNTMKLKPFVHTRPGKISFGTTLVDDEPRADMFLPAWLFIMGLFLTMFGAIIGIIFLILQISVLIIALSGAMVLLGIVALLCWKNQTIHMNPNDTFEYSTFLGNKTVYRFDDIKGLKKNGDSMTLFVADGKVHIESIAIFTDRLADRINKQLEILGIYERIVG